MPVQVPLLLLIFTRTENHARRRSQRKAWLRRSWTRGEVSRAEAPSLAEPDAKVAWRYVYVQGRRNSTPASPLDALVGDTVTLSAVFESYDNLVYKTLEALRWALAHVPFGTLLKTDDDSIVHVGRVAAWLSSAVPPRALGALYAGRVFRDSQIIRANFSRADLFHAEWFPADFVKWAVPYETYARGPYYPPYCSGGGYLLGAAAARHLVAAYDAHVASAKPVVHVEDAFVGILAHAAALAPTDAADYMQDPPVGAPHTPALYTGRMLVHRVHDMAAAYEWITHPVRVHYRAVAERAVAERAVADRGTRPVRTSVPATHARLGLTAGSKGGRATGRANRTKARRAYRPTKDTRRTL